MVFATGYPKWFVIVCEIIYYAPYYPAIGYLIWTQLRPRELGDMKNDNKLVLVFLTLLTVGWLIHSSFWKSFMGS